MRDIPFIIVGGIKPNLCLIEMIKKRNIRLLYYKEHYEKLGFCQGY